MSDSPEAFAAKNREQFAKLEAQLAGIARQYVGDLAEALVHTTPGPGLQVPWTEYVATGRLRAGWRWGLEVGPALNWHDGPYTEEGSEVIEGIRLEVTASAVVPISYLWNDVGYGPLVHDGRGRHKEPRPWVDLVAMESEAIGQRAIAKAAVT